MGKRVAALIFIYMGCTAAWFILGSSVLYRTKFSDMDLERKVKRLWGGDHLQRAPKAFYTEKKSKQEEETKEDGTTTVKTTYYEEDVSIPLVKTDLDVKLFYEPRKKGLLWYSTYKVRLAARYTFRNTSETKQDVHFSFRFPSSDAQYDNFQLRGKGRDIKYDSKSGFVKFTKALDAGEEFEFALSYGSRGLGKWQYSFTPTGQQNFYRDGSHSATSDSVTEVQKFSLAMETDFDRIDFPEGSMSPQKKTQTDAGWKLEWKYKTLVTGLNIGMQLPGELNPGPLVSRITFFAPLSLLFFLFILFIVSVLKKVDLHPMHYFFLSASFFAFHLLFAYLVDHVEVHYAFAIAAVASILLVISYIRTVIGPRFAFVETGLLQLLYLVMFSYTHFFKGYTGLIVAVFSVVTLFFVMQLTAKVKWSEVFSGRSQKPGARSRNQSPPQASDVGTQQADPSP